MSVTNNILSNYLKKINETYSNTNKQSLTDILTSFSQLSKDYHDNNTDKEQKIQYSDKSYNKCTQEEQQEFINNELQLIECLVTNSIYDKQGMVWNWHDIFTLINDDAYAKTDKINRRVVYPTSSNSRPVGEIAYDIWNGLQIIDLDIKDAELSQKLKPLIFNELSRYSWFLGICTSASRKSLHVWTKITPISITHDNRKIEYLCNFRHKYSYIYIILLKYAQQFNYTKENIMQYVDLAMCRPQQGIFISSDKDAMMNTNFIDARLDVNFESAYTSGVSSINWITHPDLKEIFHKLEWFSVEQNTDSVEISNIDNVVERDIKKSLGRKHYKHAQRWQLANTLTSIYGADKALQILIDICKDTPRAELAGDVKTASIHNKPISLWAVNELNKQHGFGIHVRAENAYKHEIEQLNEQINNADNSTDPTKILNDSTNVIKLHINSNQYLSDIKDDIIKNLGHITLLEAGAGYGKTEMIKSLKAKTLLILPFTSTIKSKVESSETTRDWLYFYGNKRPALDDILGNQNISMTIDKFSRLNVFELDQANFEYIVIDESHLLFTSSYRDVMSPTIQRLANCKSRVIMMSGTPTGEMLFFPGIKHIKVEKDDYRIKQFDIHFTPTNTEKIYEMAKMMAEDIHDGKKILFPTNRGNLFFTQVVGLIQEITTTVLKSPKVIKTFYYKKSNYGDESMDNINVDKTFGDNDIVFCSSYLSVGVDICDRYNFSIYFCETMMAQDVEQFANRVRNNDLYIKMFLEMEDSTGMPINYYHTAKLDLSFEQKDLLFVRDLIQTCNDMLERNEEESKYNPLITSLLTSNRYLKYDENDCRYYVDETTYKLFVFEERYSEYSKQLNVLINGMKYYGYTVTRTDHTQRISEENAVNLKEMFHSYRVSHYNYQTTQTLMFLNHLNDNNIDIYRELLKGSYEIFKDEKFEVDRIENNLYCTDIEILERNIPIVLGLYKFYDCDTIRDIYSYCIDMRQNKINWTKLNRIRRFVNIEHNRQRRRLDFPVLRFIKDAHKWAREHKETTKDEILNFQAQYAARYADSIRDVVIDDIQFLETIFLLIKELFDVVIIQSKPSHGNINIVPFELLWTKKTDLNDIYGGSEETRAFFLQELLDEMTTKNNEDTDEDIPELEKTSKLHLSDVERDLLSVIHSEYDYTIYSEKDKSNERFMRKQQNTNQLRDTIFDDDSDSDDKQKYIEQDIFKNTEKNESIN